MKASLVVLVTALSFPGLAQDMTSARAPAESKPLVYISGTGNISILTSGEAVGGINDGTGWAAGAKQQSVNKHDQTMEMAQNLLHNCPSIELTVSQAAQPDYIVTLNREGTPTGFGELGQSQIMVVNKRKSVIFVNKKATVKNATKSACTAIAADWLAHGPLAPLPSAITPALSPPAAASSSPATPVTAPVVAPTPSAVPTPAPALMDVAIFVRTTAAAERYSKPDTINTVLTDTQSYVTAKGLSLGKVSNSKMTIVLIVDRPKTKWIQITVQGQDPYGNVLWSQQADDGHTVRDNLLGTGMHGGATVTTLESVHKILDERLRGTQ
jgi:hypothetical protein